MVVLFNVDRLELALGIALFDPQVVDDSHAPFRRCFALVAGVARSYQVGVFSLHRLCEIGAARFDQVLEVDAGLASVVGHGDHLVLEALNSVPRHRIVKQTLQRRRPLVMDDKIVEPREIANVLAGLSRLHVLLSITILADQHVAVLGSLHHFPSTMDDNVPHSHLQPARDAEVGREEDAFVLKDRGRGPDAFDFRQRQE